MTRTRPPDGIVRTLSAGVAAFGMIAWTLNRVWLVNSMTDQGIFTKYTALARRALAGDLPVDRLGDVSTGYLWTTALLSGPLGLEPIGIRTLQIVLVSIAALLCGTAAWRRWGAVAGLVTTGTMLLSRAALLNAAELEPETLIMVLVSGALALVVWRKNRSTTILAAVLLGLAAVFRPSTILPTALLLVGTVVSEPPRNRIRLSATFFAAFTAPLLAAKITTFLLIGFWPPTMNPGTVFYEGWNPSATGYLGEAPAVVKDVEHGLGLPDGLHVAYRIVAARATGVEPSASGANRFWSARAIAFFQYHPLAAFHLMIRKGLFALHSHDAWDLATMPRKAAELPRWPWIPFGYAAALAVLGVAWGTRMASRYQIALFAFGCWVTMVLFYVTARQRNVMIPAVALLAGLAVQEVRRRWRAGARRPVSLALCTVVVTGTLLTTTGPAQREDVHTWRLRFTAEHALAQAQEAEDPLSRDSAFARAAVCLDREALRIAPRTLVYQHVSKELARDAPPERRFDLALVLIEIGRFTEASTLLESLQTEGYVPRRGARITSSISYHLVRCRLALEKESEAAVLLRDALIEAPGEARPLALHAAMMQSSDAETATLSELELAQVHDRFTATLATAHAWADLGRPDLAAPAIADLDTALPEGATSRRRSW